MSEAKAAKFKVGDRVVVTNDQGSWVKAGMEFLVTAVNGNKSFWYSGDPNGGGVWEKNLKLVATDFTAVKIGDRVRLTGNDEVHEFVVSMGNSRWLDSEKNRFESKDYATVEILERAKPELPTEPGRYRAGVSYDANYRYYMLDKYGEWFDIGNNGVASLTPMGAEHVAKYGPLTRLVPAASDD